MTNLNCITIMQFMNKLFIISNLIISLIATTGSLFFSEVMEYPPCSLCWYQRVFMYPLVFLFATAYLKEDHDYYHYSLPLTFLGQGFSAYHLLLHYEIIPESLAPCTESISCSNVYVEYLGFITIPLMSFIAFALINTTSITSLRKTYNEK